MSFGVDMTDLHPSGVPDAFLPPGVFAHRAFRRTAGLGQMLRIWGVRPLHPPRGPFTVTCEGRDGEFGTPELAPDLTRWGDTLDAAFHILELRSIKIALFE